MSIVQSTTAGRAVVWILVAAGLAMVALLGGCAQTAAYNPAYLAASALPTADRLAGKALVYTSRADDDQVWSGNPTSLTGSATTLSVPLGHIAREVAVVVFGATFREGATKANSLDGAAAYRVVVQPRVSAFSYEYDALSNAGFMITPTVVTTLEVSLLDAAGKVLNQRRYDSGKVVSPAYMFSGAPGEEIGKAAHKAMFDLLIRAAQDVREVLRLRGDGPLQL